ncbi:MAG TPA: 4-phosphoerythronate dehydrogenase [Bacteroidales bacterium]
MKIVVDCRIPFIEGLLEPYAEVIYLPGKEITNHDLLEADALIIRTRTLCSRELLDGTNVKFIGTVTTGYDHIDTDYCKIKNIRWINVPGCNSRAVAQYVISAILCLSKKYGFNPSDKTIGIIGVGQIGQKVERYARLLGMNVLLNDPPRSRNEGEKNFHSLERLQSECDILTFHPYLEKEGPDKTFHMADKIFFNKLKKPVFIINTARGGIIETSALKNAIQEGKVIDCALDSWENEPNIDKDLLKSALIATPHIAGYSLEGKAYATRIVLEQLNTFFDLKMPRFSPTLPVAEESILKIHKNTPNKISSALLYVYDPLKDSEDLKKKPDQFVELRANYTLRREYKAFRILNAKETDFDILTAFGFQTPPKAAENKGPETYRE